MKLLSVKELYNQTPKKGAKSGTTFKISYLLSLKSNSDSITQLIAKEARTRINSLTSLTVVVPCFSLKLVLSRLLTTLK